jgi:hypothetical protein
MKAKKFLSGGLKFVLVAIVAAFLALHSINLFKFVFPADQQFYAWLGFGLTGMGALIYLVMFLWDGSTILQKSVSLGMAVICSIGEVLAAIFGMMIESWAKAGFTLTENDFTSMLLVIGLLSIAHFFALIAYFAGDKIAELFGDEDKDGTPNYKDPDYKPKQKQQQPPQQLARVYSLDEVLQTLNMSKSDAQSQFGDYSKFANTVSSRFDQISGKNMKRAYYELMGQGNGHKANP